MWIKIKDILGVGGLPTTVQGITKKAKLENWERRRVTGVKGNIYEYALKSLPQSVQAELLLKQSAVENTDKNAQQIQQKMNESAWNVLASATFEQEKRAEKRLQAVLKVQQLLELNYPLMEAFDLVVASYANEQATPNTSGKQGEVVSKGSLKRWWYRVKNNPQHNWLPLLLNRSREEGCREKPIDDNVWRYFLGEYARLGAPKFATCYYLTSLVADQQGWQMPALTTLKRRINSKLSQAELVLARHGEHALRELAAPQIRTVAHLQTLEIVNGDGYQHNVFVDWYEDGRPPIRPKTWFWQDVRTRRILAYCVDDSENGDQIRQATLRLIRQYGIPKTILMDNTKAASDQQVSRQRKRHGNKATATAIDGGLLDRLGIKVIRTLVFKGKGNGRAKPIERAFRRENLPALIDLDKRLEGFFTGWGPEEKPENYQYKKGVSKALFLDLVEQGVRKFNAKPKRNTELGQGIYSFDELWERDYAQTAQVFATETQLQQLMLVGESTKVDKHGRFSLKAGGKLHGKGNIYEAAALIGTEHKYVIARFDPDDLHGTLYLYSQQGVYLCEAECVEATAFDSMESSRKQRRLENQQRKIAKQHLANSEQMHRHEMAQYERALPAPSADQTEPAQRLSFDWQQFKEGSAVKETLIEQHTISEFEQNLRKGFEMFKKAKGIK